MAFGPAACAEDEPDEPAESPTPAEEPEEVEEGEEDAAEVDEEPPEETVEVRLGDAVTGTLVFAPPAEGEFDEWTPTCPYLEVGDDRYMLRGGFPEEGTGYQFNWDPDTDPEDEVYVLQEAEMTDDMDEPIAYGEIIARDGDVITVIVSGLEPWDEENFFYNGCDDATEMLWFTEASSG